MKEKEYDLLMKDLCGRLPYGVKANVSGWDEEKQEEVNIPLRVYSIDTDGYLRFENNDYGVNYYGIEYCALFLRPLSSMTEEEKKEYIEYAGYEIEESVNGRHYENYLKDFCGTPDNPSVNADSVDWLNKNMFDYRGLIPKGLALEAPEGMYNN